MNIGRMLLLVAIAMVSTFLIYGTFSQGNLPSAWAQFGVPVMSRMASRTFPDMRTITHSIQCKEDGYDPYVTGKCDPLGAPIQLPADMA